MDEVITIGLDLAKGVFHAVGRDASGQMLFSRRLRRGQVEGFFARQGPCVVAMEACGSAHDWARRLEALGCGVKLIAPIYVKPYVVRNKNDARDADGLSQAAQRPGMRTVSIKSAEQQARASLHRVRDLMIRQRTQVMNQVRGIAAEFGLTARVGRTGLADVIAQVRAAGLPGPARLAIDLQARHLNELDAEIAELTGQIVRQARATPDARRLMTIPTVGEIVADAFLARLPNLAAFKSGRDLAAWLGLTRLDKSTGGKARTSGLHLPRRATRPCAAFWCWAPPPSSPASSATNASIPGSPASSGSAASASPPSHSPPRPPASSGPSSSAAGPIRADTGQPSPPPDQPLATPNSSLRKRANTQ